MTDYRQLPDDVKRELIFEALKFTKACVALENLTANSAELWAGRCSNAAYGEVSRMSVTEIDAAIATIEAARRVNFGARMERIYIETHPPDEPRADT